VGKNFAVLDIFLENEKLPTDGKVLCHPGLKSKVLPGPLTDLSA
jgi:hypothetical protein